jgi:hypothetical protein
MTKSPWKWVPTLYLGTGPAQVAATTLSMLLYKQLGLTNAEITLYTAWFFLPQVLRPLWAPLIELTKSRRWWVVAMQLLVGAAFGGVAFTIPTAYWLQGTICFFLLLAFSGAIYDTAVDSFYSVSLDDDAQQHFTGIRSAFYRLSIIFAQGFLVMVAGNLQLLYRNSISLSWSLVFYAAAGLFIALWLWHRAILPHARADEGRYDWSGDLPADLSDLWHEMRRRLHSFVTKYERRRVVATLFFIVAFLLPEALLSKVSMLFLVDAEHNGGLGLSPQEFGWVQGTVAVVALSLGSLAGGIVVNRDGLRRWLWPMTAATNLPHLLYLYLALTQPGGLLPITLCIFVHQFGCAFGTTAYLLQLIHYSRGPHQTTHHLLCTALMTASFVLPSMFSGALQMAVGYPAFFLMVLACGGFSFLSMALLPKR